MIIEKGQASEVQTPVFSRKQVTFLVTEKREIYMKYKPHP